MRWNRPYLLSLILVAIGALAACEGEDAALPDGEEEVRDHVFEPDAGMSMADAASGVDASGCAVNEHDCGDGCVPLDSPDACGATCTVCPGGANTTATCDGSRCSFVCNDDAVLCDGECVPCASDGLETAVCEGGACVITACREGYRVCDDGCCAFTVESLATNRNGYLGALAIDGNGHAHVAWRDRDDNLIQYATNADGSWVDELIEDSTGYSQVEVGLSPGIAVDEHGVPHVVSSFDWSPSAPPSIHYSVRDGAWSTVNADHLASTADLVYTGVTLTFKGAPFIRYIDVADGVEQDTLGFVYRDTTSWVTLPKLQVGKVGERVGMTLDADGHPWVCFRNAAGALAAAHFDGAAWSQSVVDNDATSNAGPNLGEYCDIKLDGDGLPHIAYYDDGTDDVRYAAPNGDGTWNVQVIEGEGEVGWYTYLEFSPAGEPHVAYYSPVADAVKVASMVDGAWETRVVTRGYALTDQGAFVIDADGGMHFLVVREGEIAYVH